MLDACSYEIFPPESSVNNTLITRLHHIPVDIKLQSFFTFMLPCILIDFFLNNQPDALIILIVFCHKILHVSGIFSAHHQEFSYCTFGTGKFHAGFWRPLPSRVRMELHFHPDSAWKRSSKNLHETYQCRMHSRELLMMGREDARNM